MAKAEAAAAIVLTLLCAGTAANVGRDGRVQPVRISSNSDFSVFDCDFEVRFLPVKKPRRSMEDYL